MKRVRDDSDWALTYSNIVPKVYEYVKENKLEDLSFYDAVKHMCFHTRYQPTKQMMTDGLTMGSQCLRKRYDLLISGTPRWRDYPHAWMGARESDFSEA